MHYNGTGITQPDDYELAFDVYVDIAGTLLVKNLSYTVRCDAKPESKAETEAETGDAKKPEAPDDTPKAPKDDPKEPTKGQS